MKLFIISICCALSIGLTAQTKSYSGKKITNEQLDKFIKKQMDSLAMPGLSIALINNNNIVYNRVFGVQDINTKKPVDRESIFEAASLSKTAFAYFVMRMVEKGVLNLDIPLYTYMPYPDIASDERYKLITARMVLSHQSGFPNWRYFETPDAALHVKYPDLWLKFTPGTNSGYSGEGYHYLAQVIACLTKRTLQNLDELYQQEVCQPLGLAHFYFAGNDYVSKHKVSGHSKGKSVDDWPVSFPTQDSTWFGAAGGLHTQATDYARFLIALMNHKGISKASLAEMLKNQVKKPSSDELRKGEDYEPMGLGIAITPTIYGPIYAHGGNNGDFQSGFEYLKSKKVGFVFFTNCDKGNIFNKNLSAFLMN